MRQPARPGAEHLALTRAWLAGLVASFAAVMNGVRGGGVGSKPTAS
jgi:hypothetical protein